MFNVRDTRYEDVKLTFKEEGHSYTDSIGNSYLSATTLLHRYQPAFDKAYWLKKKAKELHISEKRLEEQWGTITKEACERGTKTHNTLEDGIKDSSMFKQAVKYMIKDNGEMITVADIPKLSKALTIAYENLRDEEETQMARGGVTILSSMDADEDF